MKPHQVVGNPRVLGGPVSKGCICLPYPLPLARYPGGALEVSHSFAGVYGFRALFSFFNKKEGKMKRWAVASLGSPPLRHVVDGSSVAPGAVWA